MTVKELKAQTRKDLAGMAKTRGVAGWHAMRKDELVQALSRLARRDRRKNGNARRSPTSKGKSGQSTSANGKSSNGNSARMSIANGNSVNGKSINGKRKNGSNGTNGNGRNGFGHSTAVGTLKNLAGEHLAEAKPADRLFVVAHDAYWLHALWELSPATIQRAEAGLGLEWHSARPVIRVLDVSADENRRCVEKTVKDVPIHGGINHWYIEVTDPPGVYQLQIGYLTASGRFFGLERSNIVETPAPGACGIVDENWSKTAQGYEKGRSKTGKGDVRLREMFDKQLRRPMSTHPLTDFLPIGTQNGDDDTINLDLEVELVVFGTGTPGARLTISEESVDLREDGSFTIRLGMPEGRQVVPATITSSNGVKQQTVVLAVERNTKHLEARHFDGTEM